VLESSSGYKSCFLDYSGSYILGLLASI